MCVGMSDWIFLMVMLDVDMEFFFLWDVFILYLVLFCCGNCCICLILSLCVCYRCILGMREGFCLVG